MVTKSPLRLSRADLRQAEAEPSQADEPTNNKNCHVDYCHVKFSKCYEIVFRTRHHHLSSMLGLVEEDEVVYVGGNALEVHCHHDTSHGLIGSA